MADLIWIEISRPCYKILRQSYKVRLPKHGIAKVSKQAWRYTSFWGDKVCRESSFVFQDERSELGRRSGREGRRDGSVRDLAHSPFIRSRRYYWHVRYEYNR